jgi:propanediol dehydratase large subunit
MSRITSAWSSQPRQLAVASEARRNAADAAITMNVARTGRRVNCATSRSTALRLPMRCSSQDSTRPRA